MSEHEPETSEVEDQQDPEDAPEADKGKDDKDEAWDPERAKDKIRRLNSEAANLRKRLDEAPKPDDVQAKDSKIGELEKHTLRLEIGYELGLPLAVAKRLQGTTREELIADAEELVETFAPTKQPPTTRPRPALRGGGQPADEPEERDTRKLGERMFRR